MSSPVQLWSLPCPSLGTYQVCLLPHHLLPHNQAVLDLLPHKQRRPSLQRGFYSSPHSCKSWSKHSFFSTTISTLSAELFTELLGAICPGQKLPMVR